MKGIVLCTHPVLAAFLSLFLASYLQSSINVFVEIVEAVPVSEIEGSSFEISLTSSSYVAILFYDQSQVSEIVREQWTDAAALLNDGASGYELQGGAEVAIIDGEDPTLSEIIEMYEIAQLPTIKVFRRAILHEYRGPILRSTKPDVTIAEQIAEYLSEDCKPSVTSRAVRRPIPRYNLPPRWSSSIFRYASTAPMKPPSSHRRERTSQDITALRKEKPNTPHASTTTLLSPL